MNLFLRQISVWGWGRTLIVLLGVWLLVLVFTALPIFTTHVNNTDTRQSERLAKAFIDLEILKKQNLELRNLFNDLNIG